MDNVSGDRSKITDTLGEFKISGDELIFKACPFCHDKRSHFYLNQCTNHYYCFKCNSGGGLYSLTKKLGLSTSDPNLQKSHEIKELADAWFAEMLQKDPMAAETRQWLKERGIDEKWFFGFETGTGKVKHHLPIGYYPGKGKVVRHFKGTGYTGEEIRLAGIIPDRGSSKSCLSFTYYSTPGRISRFKLREIRGSADQSFWLGTGECGVFGLNLFDWSNHKDAIAVEGEFDCLSMQLYALKQKRCTLNVVALSGGAGGKAVDTLYRIGIKKLRVIPDNDQGGVKFVLNCIRGCKKSNLSCVVHKLPNGYKDPDDWIKSGDIHIKAVLNNCFLPGEYLASEILNSEDFGAFDLEAPDGLQDARQFITEKARELEGNDLKDFVKNLPEIIRPEPRQIMVDNIRSQSDTATERKQQISDVVYQDLLNRGEFIRTDSGYYYLLWDESKVMKLNYMDFISTLNHDFRLVEGEQDFNYVIADLKAKCHRHGRYAEVHKFAYYDKINYKLYVDRFDGKMYRLDGKKVDLISNGTDGVLFQHDTIYKPYTIEVSIDDNSLLDELIIHRINFEDSELSIDDQRELFKIWLLAIFFESIMPTKSIVLFTGVKGSGKSLAARVIGRMIFGSNYNVNSINEEKDFVAVISNNYLPAFDNADSSKKWLMDQLARASSGQMIELRQLYTTNDTERFYPRCFIILTSRTPRFKRDDVVERLIIFRLERLPNFTAEHKLIQDILDNRNRLMAELFHRLNAAILMLKDKSSHDYSGSFRLADFADFGCKISDDPARFKSILERIDEEQSQFLLEDDPFVEYLVMLMDNNSGSLGPITARDLFKSLKEISQENGMEPPFSTARGLSMKLLHEKRNLEKYFHIDVQKDRNVNLYTFTKRAEK